jgi:hypothetical protein
VQLIKSTVSGRENNNTKKEKKCGTATRRLVSEITIEMDWTLQSIEANWRM